MGMRVFVDESGNSGADLYDLNQPIFTCAAVWLNDDNHAYFTSLLSEVKAKYRLSFEGELKGKALLDTGRGRQAVAAILAEVKSRKVPCSLSVVHKPFVAAAVVVEDCTDYVYNSNFNERWTWDTTLKEPLAELIFANATPAALVRAWKAREGVDEQEFKDAYGSLLTQLTFHQDEQLSFLAAQMKKTDFSDLWETSQGTHQIASQGSRSGYAPNRFVFPALLWEAENFAEHMGLHDVSLIHDNQKQFSKTFEETWSLFRNSLPMDYTNPNGNRSKLPIERLATFSFADSEVEPGIQLADVLSSAIRVIVQEEYTNTKAKAGSFRVEMVSLCRTRELLGNTPNLIGPASWQTAMWDLLIGIPKRPLIVF